MSGLFDDFRTEFNKPNNTLVQLILINTVVFLVLLLARIGLQVAEHGAVYDFIRDQLTMPGQVNAFLHKPWTLFTYFFTHEDIFHVLYNMLFLYWFGRLIDEYLGNRRLIGLYIMGGLAGGLLFLAMFNLVPYFQVRAGLPLLGASAAAFSVAVGAATLLPNYTFHLLFFGPVRIKYIVFFFIVLSIAQSAGENAGGNLAHLGGAMMGFVYVKLLQNGTDLGRPIYWVADGWSNLFKPKPAVKVSYRQRSSTSAQTSSYMSSGSSSSSLSVPDQDEVDMILDKISRSGYESLTREEKQKLFRASQRN
ncbi:MULTISPECIES: rhomboid family intramembrane serine protease [unclassified Spirosoma]|uniref:rhomboid family intramembrane serine protease n=1 Tax=unclassified Spirosoma TaxID=2621999 RepID=UPI00095EBB55|nr:MULTISPECIES: rhomboid family intramembrane serine protease [unclassified Spirosoma]MBN8825040.1 rhomboid family intramembrane serine protease [Spirosoma sp.]OJW73333.1 MAG: rhomboid family intramembrane serine protease [Spirosoma sp. 48-14]